MSNKSSRKPPAKGQEPRQLSEIQAEYSELIRQAAETQYHAYVYSQALEEVNKKLVALNQEGAQRQALDKIKEASGVANESV